MKIVYLSTFNEFLITSSVCKYCVFVLSNGKFHLNSIDFPCYDLTFIKEYDNLSDIIIELSKE